VFKVDITGFSMFGRSDTDIQT